MNAGAWLNTLILLAGVGIGWLVCDEMHQDHPDHLHDEQDQVEEGLHK